MTHNRDFFEKQKKHSEVKTRIVTKYFSTWAKILGRKAKSLTYLDLCSGPGYFEDGKPSTPIRILGAAANLEDESIRNKLRLMFYEKDKIYADQLRQALSENDSTKRLSNKPIVIQKEVNSEIIDELPIGESTFCFIDPFGYQGVTNELLESVIENWGSDCLFYLSIAGIRRNIEKDDQLDHLDALLGIKGVETLRGCVRQSKAVLPFHKVVCESLKAAIKRRRGGRNTYFLPFAMDADKKKMVSYCLVFLTEHHKGFELMKDIMSKESPTDAEEVPLYCSREISQIELLFNSQLESLKSSLLSLHSGFSLSVSEIVKQCHERGEIFLERNVKRSIRELSEAKLVSVSTPSGKPPQKGTMGDNNIITFPGG